MLVDDYQKALAGTLALCCALFALNPKTSRQPARGATKESGISQHGSQWPFYLVYALVMGADWLQGPFLYSLYKDEHRLPSTLVSSLFTTGFVSGAVSASFVGSGADRHGRRAACAVFCIACSASCILTTVPSTPLLFAGRILGGFSTSLLFSVFESWMVTDFRDRRLGEKGLDLSRTFGVMGTLNSIVAIASGVFSDRIVAATGTSKAPFFASVVLLSAALVVIITQWDENYGELPRGAEKRQQEQEQHEHKSHGPSKLWNALADPRVLSLGFASTMFEGSMYLFVFFWGPALEATRDSSAAADLPYGIIFSCFMSCMMAASLCFNLASAKAWLSHVQLIIIIMAAATLILLALAAPRSEPVTFMLFCAFEACVGMYWPCMGYLKGNLIDDGVRAQVYGVLRIPLNVFVVASLMLIGSGGGASVFGVCAGLLLASSAGLAIVMPRG